MHSGIQIRGEKQFHISIRSNHRADVTPIKNTPTFPVGEPPLSLEERLSNGGMNRDPAGRSTDMLSAQLGNTRMLIKDLLQLGPGSIVELDKLAGEPLEVLVNERLVARGEVVMVNEKFGIRLTDVISPTERVNKLR